MRRRRRQPERQNSNRSYRQNNNFAGVEHALFQVYEGRKQATRKFSFPF